MTSTPPAGAPEPATSVARATLLVAFSAACFGAIAIFVTLGTRAGASLPTIIAWRFALAVPMFALSAIAARGPRPLRVTPRQAAALIVLGGAGQAAVTLISLSALRYIPAGTLSFLFFTFPAWVAVFAVLRGSERVDARHVAALLLALLGILVMVGSPWSAALPARGVALALGSAVIYAAYVPMVNGLQRGLAPATAAFWVAIGSCLIVSLVGAMQGTIGIPASARLWGIIGTMAVVSTLFAFLAFLAGLRILGPVRTSIIGTIEPFWTAILAALVLAQPITASTMLGGTLIGGAVVLLQWGARVAADGAR